MKATLTGKVLDIKEPKKLTEKLTIQEITVEEDNMTYKNILKVRFCNDRMDLLSSYKVGDEVTIYAYINCREWTNPQGQLKLITNISANSISKAVK
jgi:hypothetical protein